MIVLKEGLGGHGLQPYDSETGKYVDVAISYNGQEVHDFDSYVKAVLQSYGMEGVLDELSEDERLEFMDQNFKKSYEDLLKEKIHQMNTKDSAYGRQYFSQEEIDKAIPELFGEEFAKEYSKSPEHHGMLKQKIGFHSVPLAAHVLQKLRYGDVKFNAITEDEYKQRARTAFRNDGYISGGYVRSVLSAVKSGRDIVMYRGMKYDYDADPEKFENVWRGYVDTEETGDNVCLSLLGGGAYDTVTYMATDWSYSRSWANSRGMLAHALFNSNGAQVLGEHDFYKVENMCKSAWFKNKNSVLQTITKATGDASKAQEICSQIERLVYYDVGFRALICGYDAVACGAGNGDQFDILNPRRVDISSTFER